MDPVQLVLIVFIAFLAGVEGVLDQFQFHQPLVACTLIGLVTGHLTECLMLGGALQMIALGWANVGAAVAPDVAFASTAATVIFIKSGELEAQGIGVAIGLAIPLAIAGLALTMVCRTLSIGIVHAADAAATKGNYRAMEGWHIAGILLQGARVAIPIALLCMLPTEAVQGMLTIIPDWFKDGMVIGGGMFVAVGYAMVINMMATRETWPFFALGFVVAVLTDFTLIALGVIGVALALIYLNLSEKRGGSGAGGSGGSGGSADPIGDILEDY